MYGCESSATLTTNRLHYKLQTRPLVRESAPRRRAKQLSGEGMEKRKIWSRAPKGCPTPRPIGRLTVGHDINSTKHYAMKTYPGMNVQIHVFLSSALVRGEWSASRSCRFTQGETAPQHPLDRRLGGPQKHSWPHRDSNSDPVASRYTTALPRLASPFWYARVLYHDRKRHRTLPSHSKIRFNILSTPTSFSLGLLSNIFKHMGMRP
jgi:hypothetical protein